MKFATLAEFELLGKALKVNEGLRILDLQKNMILEDNLDLHEQIIEGLCESQKSTLVRLLLTTNRGEIKAKYANELVPKRKMLKVFANEIALEENGE